MKTFGITVLIVFLVAGAGLGGWLMAKSPSHDREWKPEYRVLPSVAISGDKVTVHNIRNFSYQPDGTIKDPRYYDRTFDLSKLASAWYGISHFHDYGLAHTFLSFGFNDGHYLVISVEARQEVGESYDPLKGLLRNYELIYVLGDERDIIGLRTHIRRERVYLYELKISMDTARRVLTDMLTIARDIHEHARFYNTLTDNCTTNIVDQARNLSGFRKLLNYHRILLPGYSDALAYDLGLIRTDLPLPELRRLSLLDPGACALDDPEFSAKIRRKQRDAGK